MSISELNTPQQICETKDDAENCPFYVKLNSSSYRCYKSCPDNYKFLAVDQHECLAHCPSDQFRDASKNKCVE